MNEKTPYHGLTPPPRSTDELLTERGKKHGKFTNHALYAQQLKAIASDSINWSGLAPDQREALDMILHKVGRILAGDPNEPDHWADIAGYARLIEKRLLGDPQ